MAWPDAAACGTSWFADRVPAAGSCYRQAARTSVFESDLCLHSHQRGMRWHSDLDEVVVTNQRLTHQLYFSPERLSAMKTDAEWVVAHGNDVDVPNTEVGLAANFIRLVEQYQRLEEQLEAAEESAERWKSWYEQEVERRYGTPLPKQLSAVTESDGSSPASVDPDAKLWESTLMDGLEDDPYPAYEDLGAPDGVPVQFDQASIPASRQDA